MTSDVAIRVRGLDKRFGETIAVQDVSFDIHEGEFFSLLGPSGCGKTTTLRMVAGFETPDRGEIFLRGEDVSGVGPDRRNVNMVFQQYALFPHMSVFDNVAFGLKVKKVPREERRRRVREILEIVQLEGYERRRPGQLSGGQQQRVALARALVNQPAALLLDEPLGALDVKMRKHMQLELKRIQMEMGTTFMYVTHDQDEAMAMSDRIAVMRDGAIEQIGTPREIYDRPATRFVADFIGMLNTLCVRVDAVDGGVAMMRLEDEQRIVFPADRGTRPGQKLMVAVRPERVRLEPVTTSLEGPVTRLEGVVMQAIYLGALTQFHVNTDPVGPIVSYSFSNGRVLELASGDRVAVTWNADQTSVWSDEEQDRG